MLFLDHALQQNSNYQFFFNFLHCFAAVLVIIIIKLRKYQIVSVFSTIYNVKEDVQNIIHL